MREQLLYEAITHIDDDLIDAAGDYVPRKKASHSLKFWTAAAAACLVLAVGVGGGLLILRGGMGGSSGAGGAGGAEGGSTFMSYAGPVFPLTALESSDGVTAQRDVKLDFAPWAAAWVSNEEELAKRDDLSGEQLARLAADLAELYPEGGRYERSNSILVTDSYTLTNTTESDVALTLLYPFASSLNDLEQALPTLTVDGAQAETRLHIGSYSGGFQPAYGSESQEQLNLLQLDSWEQYKALLEDGAYLERALGEFPDFTGIPVTVYRFTNPWGEPGESTDVPNPTLRVEFSLDYSQTIVLSYGFHAGSYDQEGGAMGLAFSIPQPGERSYEQAEPYYLIVLGEDITGLETSAYVTGGWDTRERLDDFGVTMERYETDLDTILRQVAGLIFDQRFPAYSADAAGSLDFETFYGLYCDYLLSYGPLAPDGGIARYDNGWLESLDVLAVDRVNYVEATVTIPAGESVTVTAVLEKQPSFDYYCAHTENQGVYGYDLVTRLGSTLTFTGQTATLEGRGQVEIVRQNFGFDLENGVNKVELELDTEHYYLEVRRLPDPPSPSE